MIVLRALGGRGAAPPSSERGGFGERNPTPTHPHAQPRPATTHFDGSSIREPSAVYSVVTSGSSPLAKTVSPADRRYSRHRVVGHLARRDAMPEHGRKLARRPLRALGKATQHKPGGLGELNEEGPAPLPHQRGNAVDQRLSIIRFALMKHAPHIDVGVPELSVQCLRLALLSRIEQPIRGLPRPIRPPSMIEGGSREIGADDVGVPVGKEPRLGAVTAAEVHEGQPRSGQVRFEQGEMDSDGEGGLRVPEDGPLFVGSLLPEALPGVPVPSRHAHASSPGCDLPAETDGPDRSTAPGVRRQARGAHLSYLSRLLRHTYAAARPRA